MLHTHGEIEQWTTYDLALIFLLLRFRRRTRFFLHLALILNVSYEAGLAMMSTGDGGELRGSPAREQLESSKRRGRYWRVNPIKAFTRQCPL